MTGLESFLEMGGYARFVWPSYGLVLIVLVLNLVLPWRRERALRSRIMERRREPVE